MKPGNQKRIFACIAVLFSFLLASICVAQNPKPAVASPVASPTANSSPAPKHTATNNTAASPTQTSAPSSSSKLGASKTTNSSQSKTPNWNFWEATAGNWVAILGVLLAATIAGLIAIYAPRALERYKLRLQAEHKKKEEEQQATAKVAAEAKGVKAYREKLKHELCHLSISDLPNVPSSLNLESIYVQLQVREEETLRYAKDEEMAALAAEEPSEQLRRSQVHIAKLAEVALSPEDALVKFRRMVVLGDPGAGKTTMERYLALQMAKQAEPKLPYLPVYVELGKFVDSKKNDLLDFIADEWEKRYGFTKARPYLEQHLNDGTALLLDGLDEVLGGGTQEEAQAAYRRVADEINRLATLFSAAPIAVTCRKAGWRGGLRGFQTLEVLDFSWEQIKEFIKLWFKSDSDKAEGLRQALEKNLRMQMLAANPLILSLIAIVYQQDLKLPEHRAELYKRCLTVLLKEWDSHRDIKRFNQFSTDGKRNLLKEVAWHFHKSGKRYFPEDELLELIADFLPTIGIQPEDNKAILEEIAAQYGLLKVQAHGWYGFVHLTFQEYFAALAVKDKGTAALSELVGHRHDPWWEEVILLLSGMMNDATPFLLGILGHSTSLGSLPERKLAANNDLFHNDLLLAARCLAYTRRITMVGLKQCIIAEVKNLLLTSPYPLDWKRSARVLVEISDKALIYNLLAMLADNTVESEKRENIASAFGELGDQSVAQRLLELLEKDTELDELVRQSIVNALGEMKATFAVPSLLYLLKTTEDEDSNTQERIFQALGEIGDKSVFPDLMEMLNDENYIHGGCIFQALVELCDKSFVAPLLLQMLLDKTIHRHSKPSIALALRELKDVSLASSMLERLQDETIEWQIRWLLTESLEGLQESASVSLMEMLENPDLDKQVRVGIAATLGSWGVRTGIPYLCEAIADHTVPLHWELSWDQGSIIWFDYLWSRVTRVLKSLDNDLLISTVVETFKQKITDGKDEEGKEGKDAWDIIVAASACKPATISRQLLEMLHRQEWQSSQSNLLSSLSALTTKALVPELLGLLAAREMYNVSKPIWALMVNAIGEVADDCFTLRALLNIGSSLNSEEEEYLAEPIYSALYSVSGRAGVRVSADGQIEELKN
ncbi:HEAT repeat domain-containing protein [Funiculus sociatus GB2-A5]|uniref:HEAT repeat domain-containing protein n=1 Tax=Funiculus sociatus GB2-A5 TaxID=2933946 RepID=A0ABV0JX35_9CYAN|nr:MULTISPECIES: HEAT repeat domain-containing protein [unclassified Trichocoleus]MBD1908071.1 HEAT repeat domain-containing protein [Trichocoleus sp. FACHB-832]MBD2062074.1 HEAT repeat domain-containing protein [Trichocoleus sp. FACHB-6]